MQPSNQDDNSKKSNISNIYNPFSFLQNQGDKLNDIKDNDINKKENNEKVILNEVSIKLKNDNNDKKDEKDKISLKFENKENNSSHFKPFLNIKKDEKNEKELITNQNKEISDIDKLKKNEGDKTNIINKQPDNKNIYSKTITK